MAEPLSLGQLGRVLLRYWILIVVGTLIGAGLAFGVTRLMTPVYRATAIQLVKGLSGTGAAANYEAAQYAVSRAKTYPSFVYNSGVLEDVRSDLGNTRTLDELRKDLSAINPVNTPLLEISAVAATPEEAQKKANSAARHLARFITEIETVGNRSPISVETAVQAALPTEATAPKTLVITALGALIGFALATIAALLNSYIRYQRRTAFRRRQAMNWMSGAGSAGPNATPSPGTAAVAEGATAQADTNSLPTAAPPSAAKPPPDPQPGLVEVGDTELVKVTAETGRPAGRGPVLIQPAILPSGAVVAEGEDRRDTINLRLSELSAALAARSNGSSVGRPVGGPPPTEPPEAAPTGAEKDAPDDAGRVDEGEDGSTTDATEDADAPGDDAPGDDTAEVATMVGEEPEIAVDGDPTVLITLPPVESVDHGVAAGGEKNGGTVEQVDDSRETVAR